MFAKTLVMIAVALAVGTPLHALAASFNAKPGAWEMTISTLVAGNPIPPEALANLPPEKRAKVEETMKARAGKPSTHTYKTCVSQKELDQDRIIKSENDDSKCARKVLSKSATKLVMEQACPAPHASTSQMTIEAKTPENLVASIDMVQGGASGKVHVDMKGHWLGASCAGIGEKD
jgi:hypothetical protein